VDDRRRAGFRNNMRAIQVDLEKSQNVVRGDHPGVDGYEGD
jgi:hypothetical protein